MSEDERFEELLAAECDLLTSNFPYGEVVKFSLPKLMMLHRLTRRRGVQVEMRQLLIATAAATGGKAPENQYRRLMAESKGLLPGAEAGEEPVSQMPLCQEDFERMMREEN